MSTEMTKLENVKKSCKTAATILKVLKIITIVLAIMFFIGGGVMFAMRNTLDAELANHPEIVEDFDAEMNIAGVRMDYGLEGLANSGQYSIAFLELFVFAGVIFAVMAVILSFIRKIFIEILESESPFTEVVLKTVKRSFILVVIFVAVGSGLGAALFFALFFWCIYTIFQYGCELQKQADETL